MNINTYYSLFKIANSPPEPNFNVDRTRLDTASREGNWADYSRALVDYNIKVNEPVRQYWQDRESDWYLNQSVKDVGSKPPRWIEVPRFTTDSKRDSVYNTPRKAAAFDIYRQVAGNAATGSRDDFTPVYNWLQGQGKAHETYFDKHRVANFQDIDKLVASMPKEVKEAIPQRHWPDLAYKAMYMP